MKEKITASLNELFASAAIELPEVQLSRPAPEFGDYATNIALQLAPKLGQNPRQVAEQIAEKLRQENICSEVSIAGPGFINMRVSGRALYEQLAAQWSASFGENQDGVGKTAIVDYPSPNMAKPYSAGHLRPGNQGWAAKQLLEKSGWTVHTDNHLGDYGAPFGIWVTGFLHFSSEDALAKDGVYELGRVYIQTKKALKEEAERGDTTLSDEVQQWLLKLEAGDAQAVQFSEHFNKISLEHIHRVMHRLKISTDMELGEAFFAPQGKKYVQELLKRGIAEQNPDGSVIVRLDEYGFDTPLLIQKSNGTALYATTDLATIMYREHTFSPDKVVYAVGAEQQFYFAQLAALAKKMGIETELYHLWFGMIDQLSEDGAREKMSSRKGVILMEELLDTAEAKAREITAGRDISQEDVEKIALGAIKFSDFVADRRTNILFDWKTIFALTGMSGPYIQYAAVRVNNVLKKSAPAEVDTTSYDFAAEKILLAKILEFPEVVQRAASALEPHKVANYLYECARELNRYYEITRVSDAPEVEKAARCEVLQKMYHVLEQGLSIIGIEIPTKM